MVYGSISPASQPKARAIQFVLALALTPLASAQAQAVRDPASTRVEAFDSALLGVSKRGDAKSGRLHALVEQSFNIPVMAQIAVGPGWSAMSAAERGSIVAAMTRYTAARFEHDLGSSNGTIALDAAVQVRGPDHLVKGQLLQPGEPPVRLVYRLREYGGAWKIIDIFFDGVSQLATERADFASSISVGAGVLVRKLDEASAKLRGG